MQQSAQSHLDEVMRALEKAGLRARVENFQGQTRILTPILDMQTGPDVADARNPELEGYAMETAENWSSTMLFIATEGQGFPLRVGVLGQTEETGQSFASDDWKQAGSAQEAVAAFQDFWDNRDSYLAMFTGDVGQNQA